MIAKLFFTKGMKNDGHNKSVPAKLVRSKRICLGLIALLMSVPLLASCSDGTTGSSSTTTNGTASATSATSSSFGGISQLKMFDANNGWATTGSAVLKTTDGGQQWTDVTPADWETTASQSDPSGQNNKGVSAAFFLNANDAWIVSSNASSVEDQIAGTALASTQTPNIQAQVQVYVRATTDGGKTWMDAHQIQVTNLSLVSPPYFINQHEGWLTLTTTSSDGKRRDALIYHSTDGGITWQQASTITGSSNSNSPFGLTMVPNCTASSNSNSQCTTSTTSGGQACTTTGTTDTLGWLAHANKQSLLLQQSLDSGLTWSNLGWSTPTGAPGQTNDSLIMASSPIMLDYGTAVLPIQMQSNPNGNDPSNFYLHLYKMSFAAGSGASQTELTSTSPFVSQLESVYHTVSAPDLGHIFVLGQDDNNGTIGNTNLYEWNGGGWQTLSSQISASSSSSGSDLSSLTTGNPLSNLDFISDTEGWATGDSGLYHITLNGNTATWTQVTTTTATVTRSPGQVVSAPANPGACSTPPTPPAQTNPGSPSPTATGERTFTLVNNTSQTIWAAAAGNAGFAAPANGGWVMTPGSTFTVKVANNWAGRFWGRTYCSFDSSGHGTCETGSCGNVLQCNGATAGPPQTLAEFLLSGWGGNDFYDVSSVDGFNVPMTITPVGGAQPDPNNKYRCGVAGCGVDLNPSCPTVLQDKDASGRTVGCKSACAVFGTDQYCCTGTYVGAACNPKTWPVDYAAYFKSQCPDSYSYAYDDATSTFTDTNANYRITFGPASP
jgi:Thaumatin family.